MVKSKTIQDLFAFAKNPDFFRPPYKDDDEVRKVMKEHSFAGFNPKQWYLYCAVLATEHTQRYEVKRTDHTANPEDPLENPVCPVCGGARRLLSPEEHFWHWSRASLFGITTLWVCPNGETILSHCIRWALFNRIKQNNPGITIQKLSQSAKVVEEAFVIQDAWVDQSVINVH